MSLPTAAVVYGNYNTNNGKTEENAKYIKAIIQRYVNTNFDFTTGVGGLNTNDVNKAQSGYLSCIANFTNETNSTRTASITLEDDYICPYTAYQTTVSTITLNTFPTLHEINNACANLQRLSSTFKQDIIDFKYGDINYVQPSSLITLPTNNNSRVPLTAAIAKNAYSSMIYYIEYAIFMLSHLMKSPFTGIGTQSGNSITLTSYSSAFNTYITGNDQSNYVELVASYNTGGTTPGTFTYLGFSHPGDQRQKVIDLAAYKDYKRYVLFVRDTLKLLQSNPNFTRRNNSESPLPNNDTNKIGLNNPAYRVSDVVANGINALTAAIDTFETQYDSRFNAGGKYLDSQNGLYANRGIIETKLKELYQFQGTVVDNEKQYFTVSMAAGAATTVVACGLLYYIFTEL